MQWQGNGLLPLLFLERKANMSDKLNTLEALRLASLKAKGYTAEQIAELSSAMEDIIKDINDSLKTMYSQLMLLPMRKKTSSLASRGMGRLSLPTTKS